MIKAINELKQLMIFALTLTEKEIYLYIIHLLLETETNPSCIKNYNKFIADLCEEDNSTIKEIEDKNPMVKFDLDMSDYHKIVYNDIAEKIKAIFDEKIYTDKAFENSRIDISLTRASFLVCLSVPDGCRNNFGNKTYRSNLYQLFLKNRLSLVSNVVLPGCELLQRIYEDIP